MSHYTVGEAAKKMGVAASTLRYYDREGLLPYMERDENGVRLFDDGDIEWLKFLEYLKRSGLSIKEIRQFVEWQSAGDATLAQRRDLFHERKRILEERIASLRDVMAFVACGCWFYDVAVEAGTIDAPSSMDPNDVPEEVRRLRERGEALFF